LGLLAKEAVSPLVPGWFFACWGFCIGKQQNGKMPANPQEGKTRVAMRTAMARVYFHIKNMLARPFKGCQMKILKTGFWKEK
jgi:hypothetical protein